MPKLKVKEKPQLKMNVTNILRQSNHYLLKNPQFTLCIFVVNLCYMLVFKSIEGGITNPLSILWVITYYMFWCVFYRYYYGLKPYLFSKTIFGSMAPSSKALLLMLLVIISIVFLPIIPLLLGFDDIYLNYYERYMASVESLAKSQEIGASGGEIGASLLDVAVIYGILALLSPILICNPYMAWISALRGQNASFRKAGSRTKGNYFKFVIISALLLYPEALSQEIDKIFKLQNWFNYTVSTIIFVYTNVIFAKMYDFFYLKH